MDKWIPASERTPEVNPTRGVPEMSAEQVLVWPRRYEYPTAFYFTDCGFAKNGKALDYVTHWMPMPKGPDTDHDEQ